MRSSSLLLLAVALASVAIGTQAQWCLNETGSAVDWFVIVKVPRLSSSSGSGVDAGTAYLYGDVNSINSAQFWSQSTNQVDDATSSVGRTLQQIYDLSNRTNSNGYVMYNDEAPDGGTSSSFGHTKGMLAWSAASAFWLIHSVPKYMSSPDNQDTYDYPTSGKQYGQTMLCMSLNLANVDKVMLQLQYTNPQVYGVNWASDLTSKMPNGNAFVNNDQTITTASSSVAPIQTVGGKKFQHFGKTAKWGKSIFGDLLAPAYKDTMLVETWQRPYEEPLLPPTSLGPVYSVLTVKAPSYANWDGVGWKLTQDHSKWAIGLASSVVCIGDINKQQSQWKRSGGMMCTDDARLHTAFTQLIDTTDQDSRRPSAVSAVANATQLF